MPRGQIIAFRNDRLGARLLSLVNAQRLALDYELPFAMYWPEVAEVGSEFNDPTELFDRDFVATHFIGADTWRELRKSSEKLVARPDLTGAKLREAIDAGQSFTVEMAFGCLSLQGEDASATIRRCGDLFRQLPMEPQLQQLTTGLAETLSGATAYHIRRGDLISDIRAKNRRWPHKFGPNEYYYQHIAGAYDASNVILLFSDDAGILSELKGRFPKCKTLDQLIDYGALSHGARDMLELYAMACCDAIIAPEQSAFSTTAAELGGVRRASVKEDLPEGPRSQASENLLERVAASPITSGNAGEIGQSLTHLEVYLCAHGREEEARALYARFVEGGGNISYIVPQAMALMIAAGQFKQAIALGGMQAPDQPYHEKDLMTCRLLEAAAFAAMGELGSARHRLENAFWLAPTFGDLSRILPILLMNGGLEAASFPPVAADLVALTGRALGYEKTKHPALARLAALSPADAPSEIPKSGNLEVVQLDWAHLLGGARVAERALDSAIGKKLIRIVERKATSGNADIEIVGLSEVVRAYQGDLGEAVANLDNLVEKAPDHAMTRQRRSHVLRLMRAWSDAADEALIAVQLLDVPTMRAWSGICLAQANRLEEARDHLTEALGRGSALATGPANLARVLTKLDEPTAALNAIDTALQLAPNNARFQVTKAELLAETGEVKAAFEVLETLRESRRMPNSALRLASALRKQMGEQSVDAELHRPG
ncbi:MAG: hypothetical protein AAF503_12020 [Pseudomonadota bacterium]